MPIYQINLWVCEICGKAETTTKETTPYSDPVVIPPNGEWGYIGTAVVVIRTNAEEEYTPTNISEKLACPDCMQKDKSS